MDEHAPARNGLRRNGRIGVRGAYTYGSIISISISISIYLYIYT